MSHFDLHSLKVCIHCGNGMIIWTFYVILWYLIWISKEHMLVIPWKLFLSRGSSYNSWGSRMGMMLSMHAVNLGPILGIQYIPWILRAEPGITPSTTGVASEQQQKSSYNSILLLLSKNHWNVLNEK